MRSRAPVLGGSFAMWGFIFSISCCGMIAIRQREDPINSIVGGFTTGFVLAIRGIDLSKDKVVSAVRSETR